MGIKSFCIANEFPECRVPYDFKRLFIITLLTINCSFVNEDLFKEVCIIHDLFLNDLALFIISLI